MFRLGGAKGVEPGPALQKKRQHFVNAAPEERLRWKVRTHHWLCAVRFALCYIV